MSEEKEEKTQEGALAEKECGRVLEFGSVVTKGKESIFTAVIAGQIGFKPKNWK